MTFHHMVAVGDLKPTLNRPAAEVQAFYESRKRPLGRSYCSFNGMRTYTCVISDASRGGASDPYMTLALLQSDSDVSKDLYNPWGSLKLLLKEPVDVLLKRDDGKVIQGKALRLGSEFAVVSPIAIFKLVGDPGSIKVIAESSNPNQDFI